MGGKVGNAINKGSAPYCFRLGGQNHHNIGLFLPPEGKQPRFMQLYFYYTEQEVSNRIKSLNQGGDNELDPTIVESLHKMVYEHNPLAKMCKLARERIDNSNLEPVRIHLLGTRKRDGRQFNLPTTDELAALIVGSGDTERNVLDIIIDEQARGLRRFSELHPSEKLHPSFMAMQYPLLFPYGEDEFTTKIKHRDAETTKRKKKTTVTIREYYAYRFQVRRKEGELVDGVCGRGGRLRQQYIVDAFTCVEETRLDYIRKNPKDIRKFSLGGLIDAVAGGETTHASLGHRVILPPSFPG